MGLRVYDPGMDWIVCGDALWISCGTWIEFWSGAIGASVGAAVALIAIVRTIGTQRQLFAIERAQNYTATQLADNKRKAELDLQLAAQRQDVKLQLEFQAREASRQRELAAISDLVAAGHAMMKRYRQGLTVIEDLVLQGDSAVVRWRMEMTHRGLAAEIWSWSHHLGYLALRLFDMTDDETVNEDSRIAAFDALSDAVTTLQFVATSWPTASTEHRDILVSRLIREREKHEDDAPEWVSA